MDHVLLGRVVTGRRKLDAGVWALAAVLGVFSVADAGPARAQSGACANPSSFCSRQLDAGCLARVGAGAIAADQTAEAPTGCADQFTSYRECLSMVAAQCGPAATNSGGRPASGSADGATMTAVWNEIKDSGNVAALESFATTYAGTPLAALAQARVAALKDRSTSNADERVTGGAPNAPLLDRTPSGFSSAAPAPALSSEEVGRRVESVLQRFAACTVQNGDPASSAIVERLLINDLNDPMLAAKLADPTPVDDGLITHFVRAGDGDDACGFDLISALSAVSPEATVTVAELFAEAESLNGDMMVERPTIGAVNLRLRDLFQTFSADIIASLTMTAARAEIGAPATEDAFIEALDAVEAWSDAREHSRLMFPENIDAETPAAFSCDWTGTAIACAPR